MRRGQHRRGCRTGVRQEAHFVPDLVNGDARSYTAIIHPLNPNWVRFIIFAHKITRVKQLKLCTNRGGLGGQNRAKPDRPFRLPWCQGARFDSSMHRGRAEGSANDPFLSTTGRIVIFQWFIGRSPPWGNVGATWHASGRATDRRW
jgi:hypothetical protein